jgi:hypothetical protein
MAGSGRTLNQIEICFSVVQHTALTPHELRDLDELEGRLLAFQRRLADHEPDPTE